MQQGQTRMRKEVARQQHSNVKGCLQPIEHQAEPLHGAVIQLIVALQQVSHRTIQVGIIRIIIPPIEVHLQRQAIAIEDQHLVAQQDQLQAAPPEVRLDHQEEDKSALGSIEF